MSIPFSISIFVADGDPDGLRIVERTNWNGKAVIFPRVFLPKVINQLSEFRQAGVYLLIGPHEDGDGEKLYIGEGDPVGDRLKAHYTQKDFWNRAVFFVAGPGQLNKAHVQYLEAQLIQRAKAAKRMSLENGKNETDPSLSVADQANMRVFLDNLLGILPVIGVHAFEQSSKPSATQRKATLICRGKGVEARGYEASQGFIVLQDSQAVMESVPSMKQHLPSMYAKREELIKNGVLAPDGGHYRFTQNYTFNSPSAAAGVVLGSSVNGRLDWCDAAGRTLKELQEQEARDAMP